MYISVPSTPVVAVDKCSRSTTSVVVVLCAPTQGDEIIDEYRYYTLIVYNMIKLYHCFERDSNDTNSICLMKGYSTGVRKIK